MVDETMTKEREKFTESIEKLFGDSFKLEDFFNNSEIESLEPHCSSCTKTTKGDSHQQCETTTNTWAPKLYSQ
jgi:hypothetical protein